MSMGGWITSAGNDATCELGTQSRENGIYTTRKHGENQRLVITNQIQQHPRHRGPVEVGQTNPSTRSQTYLKQQG